MGWCCSSGSSLRRRRPTKTSIVLLSRSKSCSYSFSVSSAFDTTTGAPLNGPATEPIRVYEIRAVDHDLQVLVDAPSDDVRWTEWRL